MDRLHAQPPERIVHDREVAEAREPLGVGAQRCQVRVVEGPQGAVAAPEKEDGPKVRVVDHALQVGAPYAVGGIEPAARGAVKVLAAPRVQPPAAQHVEAFLVVAAAQRVGARRDGHHAHAVARMQVGRPHRGTFAPRGRARKEQGAEPQPCGDCYGLHLTNGCCVRA